jgi:hypothetical protein
MKPKKLNTYQKAKKVSYELGYAKGVEDERRRVMELQIKKLKEKK